MDNKKLVSHVSGDEKKELIRRFKENKDLFERITYLLNIKIKDARKQQLSRSSYDSPAWSENQADLNGYQRALEEVITLIK